MAYRPEQTNVDTFINELDRVLSIYKRSFVIGDMNINVLNTNESVVLDYIEAINSNGFCLLNKIDPTYATRILNTISTIFDHCITDILDKNYQLSYLDASISDHRQLILQYAESRPTQQNYSTTYVDYEQIDHSANWEPVKSAKSFEEFEILVKSLINMYTNRKVRRVRSKPIKPWITKTILDMIQRRETLFKYHKRFPTNLYFKQQIRISTCGVA